MDGKYTGNLTEVSEELLLSRTDNCTDPQAYFNFTRENPEVYMYQLNIAPPDLEVAKTLYGIFVPILTLITVVANTLIVLVLIKPKQRTPTNIVLLCMALSDMFTVIPPTPWFMYMFTFGNHDKPLHPVAACYAYRYMTEVIPNLFHTASIWLTLALAIQRYVYVCKVVMARVCCTVPRVLKGILLIYGLALVHQSTRFFDESIDGIPICWNGALHWTCRSHMAKWVREIKDLYFNLYFWFRVFFIHLLPCVSLITLNILLCSTLKQAQDTRAKLLGEKSKSAECKKLRDSQCTTLMLVVVVTVFLLVEIPLAVLTILHIVDSSIAPFLNYELVNQLIMFSNFSITASYPINFAIYCGMSRQFRDGFKELFSASISGSSSTLLTEAEPSRVPLPSRKGSTQYSRVNGGRKSCTNETAL